MSEAVYLVEDGNICGMPTLTREDIRTKKKIIRTIIDEDLMLDEKRQVLYSDVMHVDSNKFLITVCESLQLIIQNRIER
jgi:hypothetical protein